MERGRNPGFVRRPGRLQSSWIFEPRITALDPSSAEYPASAHPINALVDVVRLVSAAECT
jgi:hypothetical protein